MRTAIHAFEQDSVDFGEQSCDVGDNFHLPVAGEFLGILADAGNARFDVLAATFVGGNDAGSRNVVGMFRVIQDLGEGDDMRGVGADYPDPDVGCQGKCGEEKQKTIKNSHCGHCTLRLWFDSHLHCNISKVWARRWLKS